MRDTELKSTLDHFLAQGVCPKLVVTDSQAFARVSKDVPENITLTSFSILFARYKGELETQLKGVAALSSIEDGDHILIAPPFIVSRSELDFIVDTLHKVISEETHKLASHPL